MCGVVVMILINDFRVNQVGYKEEDDVLLLAGGVPHPVVCECLARVNNVETRSIRQRRTVFACETKGKGRERTQLYITFTSRILYKRNATLDFDSAH